MRSRSASCSMSSTLGTTGRVLPRRSVTPDVDGVAMTSMIGDATDNGLRPRTPRRRRLAAARSPSTEPQRSTWPSPKSASKTRLWVVSVDQPHATSSGASPVDCPRWGGAALGERASGPELSCPTVVGLSTPACVTLDEGTSGTPQVVTHTALGGWHCCPFVGARTTHRPSCRRPRALRAAEPQFLIKVQLLAGRPADHVCRPSESWSGSNENR